MQRQGWAEHLGQFDPPRRYLDADCGELSPRKRRYPTATVDRIAAQTESLSIGMTDALDSPQDGVAPCGGDVVWSAGCPARTDSARHVISGDDALWALAARRLPAAESRSALRHFLAQFDNLLIQVLLVSAAVTLALSHGINAAVILAVVIANAAISFVQEGRAEPRRHLTPFAACWCRIPRWCAAVAASPLVRKTSFRATSVSNLA